MRQRLDVVCGFVFAFMGIFYFVRVVSESIIQFVLCTVKLCFKLFISQNRHKPINHSAFDVNAIQLTRELGNTTRNEVWVGVTERKVWDITWIHYDDFNLYSSIGCSAEFSALEIIIKSLNLSHCKLSSSLYQGFCSDALSSFHANIEESLPPKTFSNEHQRLMSQGF